MRSESWTGLCRNHEAFSVFERAKSAEGELDSFLAVPADVEVEHLNEPFDRGGSPPGANGKVLSSAGPRSLRMPRCQASTLRAISSESVSHSDPSEDSESQTLRCLTDGGNSDVCDAFAAPVISLGTARGADGCVASAGGDVCVALRTSTYLHRRHSPQIQRPADAFPLGLHPVQPLHAELIEPRDVFDPAARGSVAVSRYAQADSLDKSKVSEALRTVLKRLHCSIEVLSVRVRWYAAYPR